MKCTNCGEKLQIGQVICPHCRWHTTLRRVVEIVPERTRLSFSPPQFIVRFWLSLTRGFSRISPARREQKDWMILLGILPGLPHLYCRRYFEGVVWLSIVVFGWVFALYFCPDWYLDYAVGVTLMFHSLSVFQFAGFHFARTFSLRLLAFSQIMFVLAFGIYAPFMIHLNVSRNRVMLSPSQSALNSQQFTEFFVMAVAAIVAAFLLHLLIRGVSAVVRWVRDPLFYPTAPPPSKSGNRQSKS